MDIKTKNPTNEKMQQQFSALAKLEPNQVLAEAEKITTGITFTEEEEAAINKLAAEIDITDTASLISYGAQASERVQKYNQDSLSRVATSQLGEAGEELATFISTLKNAQLNPEEEKNPIKRWFQKKKISADELIAQHSSITNNIEVSRKEMTNRLQVLTTELANFDELIEAEADYCHVLSMYIEAAKRSIEQARTETLPALISQAEITGDQLDAQKAQMFAEAINQFNVTLQSKEVERLIAIQTIAQVFQLKSSYTGLAQKINDFVTNGIRMWYQSFSIRNTMETGAEIGKVYDQAQEYTNQMYKDNMKLLHMTMNEQAKRSVTPLLEVETVQYTTDEFIAALNDTLSITKEGMRLVRENDKVLQGLGTQLKTALVDYSKEFAAVSIEEALETSEPTTGTPTSRSKKAPTLELHPYKK